MKNTNIVRMTIILVVMIMMLTSLTACAQGNNAKFVLGYGFDNVVIENVEGNYLEYVVDNKGDVKRRGNMSVLDYGYYADPDDTEDDGGEGSEELYIEVPDSEMFVVRPRDEDDLIEQPIDFGIINQYNKYAYISAEYVKKIEIEKQEIRLTGDDESTFDYSIYSLIDNDEEKIYYNVIGNTIGRLCFRQTQKGIELTGATGKTIISAEYKGAKKSIAMKSYYMFGNKVRIYVKDGKLIVSPAPRISERETKRVTSLYLRPVNDGKNMFLTWNKVKKAKSYVVYKYDYAKRKYKRVEVRGRNANYLNIGHADLNEKYRYKVAAMSKAKGKGKKVCKRSYPVWAVAQENAYGNASKVTTNMSEIKGKAGKAYRLKAAVSSKGDKTLLSDNIRWYCSNHKVATIDKKTGKVKLKKKGKCRIWAKAHNGKNSRQIPIIVK